MGTCCFFMARHSVAFATECIIRINQRLSNALTLAKIFELFKDMKRASSLCELAPGVLLERIYRIRLYLEVELRAFPGADNLFLVVDAVIGLQSESSRGCFA